MNIAILKKELKINELKLMNTTNPSELADLLIQRSNIKDMLIEALQACLDKQKLVKKAG